MKLVRAALESKLQPRLTIDYKRYLLVKLSWLVLKSNEIFIHLAFYNIQLKFIDIELHYFIRFWLQIFCVSFTSVTFHPNILKFLCHKEKLFIWYNVRSSLY